MENQERAQNSCAPFWKMAYFEGLEVGYTFVEVWSPRFASQLDYARGDSSPNDGENNRFDTLYGARAFDFGATGIYIWCLCPQ